MGFGRLRYLKEPPPRLDRQTIVRLKYKEPGDPKTRGTICRVFFSPPVLELKKSIATTV